MFDLVWQVQYWCQFLYFVTPEIVSRKFQSGKMHLRATLSHLCATWWPLEAKNWNSYGWLTGSILVMIPIFLAPGIVSHNFQSGKMHLSVILSHLCGVCHLGMVATGGQKLKFLCLTWFGRFNIGVNSYILWHQKSFPVNFRVVKCMIYVPLWANFVPPGGHWRAKIEIFLQV